VDPRVGTRDVAKLYSYSRRRAKVALIKGESRRKHVYEALVAIDGQILPALKTRNYVLIKPNGFDPSRTIVSTQLDTVHGIIDYDMHPIPIRLGAPLPPPPGEDRPMSESEKRKFHAGIRAGNLNIYFAIQRVIHNCGSESWTGSRAWKGMARFRALRRRIASPWPAEQPVNRPIENLPGQVPQCHVDAAVDVDVG
jgi:hypothetical protein